MLAPLRRRAGFSLLETLVVLAIIMVLLTLLVPVLTRALRMAKRVATGEEMRQEHIGIEADNVHDQRAQASASISPQEIVDAARTNFYREAKGSQAAIYSSVLYTVKNDLEFRAYWYTLLNPQNTELPKLTRRGNLVAFTPEGQRFELPPSDSDRLEPNWPMGWGFVSTQLAETGRGDLGGNVAYADGHIVYVPYPREFPMTRMVAELSHRFYMEVIHH